MIKLNFSHILLRLKSNNLVKLRRKIMKYKDWLAEWLHNYIQPSNKQRTFERYKGIVSLHIAPKLGDYELSELTPIILQKFITNLSLVGNKKTSQGLSANYTNCVISVIRNSLKTANVLGLADKFTAVKIKRPKPTEKQVDCFTLLEQKRIEKHISASKKQKLKGVVICLYTGLRIGELLALTWEDIDFTNKILYVTKSCHDGYVNGKHCVVIDTPKTENSLRQIPLSKPLITLLKNLKRNTESDYVISHNGKPILIRSYQRAFELLLKKLNIPRKGFHSTRHTFATRAIECGMDIKSLSEILGHKNATITLNRYAHSLWDHKLNMMNKLSKLL